nr:MAG TPA: hypothetical protein [Caudoviricetes sp.]
MIFSLKEYISNRVPQRDFQYLYGSQKTLKPVLFVLKSKYTPSFIYI